MFNIWSTDGVVTLVGDNLQSTSLLSAPRISTCDFDLRSTRQLTRTLDSVNENIPISIFCFFQSVDFAARTFDGEQTMFQSRLA